MTSHPRPRTEPTTLVTVFSSLTDWQYQRRLLPRFVLFMANS